MNPTIQVKLFRFRIYITDITYLVTSGMKLLHPKTENIPQESALYDQFHREFPDGRILMYSGKTRYGYESGLRLSLQQMKRTTALNAAELQDKALTAWKNVIKGILVTVAWVSTENDRWILDNVSSFVQIKRSVLSRAVVLIWRSHPLN